MGHQDIYVHYGVGRSTFYDNLRLAVNRRYRLDLQNLRFAFLMMTPVNCMTWKLDGLPARLSLLFAVALQLSIIHLWDHRQNGYVNLRDLCFAMRMKWTNVFRIQARYWQPRKSCYGLNVAECRIT